MGVALGGSLPEEMRVTTVGAVESATSSPVAATVARTPSLVSSTPESARSTASPTSQESQAAIGVHANLLASLAATVRTDSAASIASDCVLLYTRCIFGVAPLCYEATLREGISRFLPLIGDDYQEVLSSVLRDFTAANEPDRVGALRQFTQLTSLCAFIAHSLPASLVRYKHLIAPIFLRAAREMLRIYEDYDLEHPDSTSLSVRVCLAAAIQHATGKTGVAWNTLGQAGLIAQRMRLYDERSLEGREPLEAQLLRYSFWQLYISDKTAVVVKGRPVTLHERLFDTALSLQICPRNPKPLLNNDGALGDARLECRLIEGFRIICRLWTMAAELMEALELGTWAEGEICPGSSRCLQGRSITKLTESYFAIITLANNLPAWVREESPAAGGDRPEVQINSLQLQRMRILVTISCVKFLLSNAAIRCNMPEVIGLSPQPLTLAMRQIELAQDFLNVIEGVPVLHIQIEGEHCVSKKGRCGALKCRIGAR